MATASGRQHPGSAATPRDGTGRCQIARGLGGPTGSERPSSNTIAPPASSAAKPIELIQRSQSNPSAKSTTAAAPVAVVHATRRNRVGRIHVQIARAYGRQPRAQYASERGEDEAHEDRERLVAGTVDHPLEARSERVAEVGEDRSVTFDLGRRRAHECRDGLDRSRARSPRARAA